MSIIREIVRAFFLKKKKRKRDKVNIGMAECGREKKNHATTPGNRSQSRRHFTVRNWNHRRLQSYFVRFAIRHLPTRTNPIQREWPHYIQLDHQLHTYCQWKRRPFLDNAGIDIAGNWIFLREERFATFVVKTAGDKVVNSLFRAYA